MCEHGMLFRIEWPAHSTIYRSSQTSLIVFAEQSAAAERVHRNTMLWKEKEPQDRAYGGKGQNMAAFKR